MKGELKLDELRPGKEPLWFGIYDVVIGVLMYPVFVWPYLYYRLTGKIKGGRWVGKR